MIRKRKSTRKRIPILVVGDAAAPTGFARVLHSILDRVKHKYEIHHLGVNYGGDPHDADWKVCARLVGDVYGINRLQHLLSGKPRLVFMVNDVWILGRYAPILKNYKDKLKTVMYFPVDGDLIDSDFVQQLDGVDQLVAYNQFGKRVMQQAIDEVRRESPDFKASEIEVIPHGVDTRLFHPYSKELGTDGIKRQAKSQKALLPIRKSF